MTYINIFKSKLSTYDLIKKAFFRSIGIKVLDDNIKRDSHGKIFINNGYYVSISRSKGLSVCAISNKNIGIDIEKIRKYDFKSIINKMHPSVIEFSKSKPSLEKNYFIWTNVEAYLKFQGTGIVNFDDMKIEKSKFNNFSFVVEGYLITFYQESYKNIIPCIALYKEDIKYYDIKIIEFNDIKKKKE